MKKVQELLDLSFIYVQEDSLSQEECEYLLSIYNKYKDEMEYEGITDEGYREDLKVAKNINIIPEVHKKADKLLHERLAEGVLELRKINDYLPQELFDTGYMFQKYEAGGRYNKHTDNVWDGVNKRELVFMWYLNTLEKEQGGETYFNQYDISITPQAGKLVLFPAQWTHVHQANEVKYGEKFIITGWLHYG